MMFGSRPMVRLCAEGRRRTVRARRVLAADLLAALIPDCALASPYGNTQAVLRWEPLAWYAAVRVFSRKLGGVTRLRVV
jgi:hypothetical protein